MSATCRSAITSCSPRSPAGPMIRCGCFSVSRGRSWLRANRSVASASSAGSTTASNARCCAKKREKGLGHDARLAREAERGEAALNVGGAHQETPEEAAAVVLDHADDRSLIDGKV